MDDVDCVKGEVSDTEVVSLATETALNNSGLVFSDGTNMLASADLSLDDGTTYVTLPLHLLQDGSILDSGSGIHNLILKNLASSTVYLDSSQLALLSGGSSQVVLSTDGLVGDGNGRIILDAEYAEKNSNKISIIPGLGVDIATTDLTDIDGEGENGDVVTDPTNNGEIMKSGCLTLDLSTTIPLTSTSQQNYQVRQPSSSRRGPGRPRREDTEVDPPVGKGPFKCHICGKEFLKSSQCKRHVKCHSDDKPFLCNLCSSSFNVESNLILHKATHNVDDPRCPECNKKFSRIASLKAHVMLHEKEESLFCSECGDEFSTMSQLEEHKKEHQNEWVKPTNPQCRQCKWQFSRASALREHMKEHYKVKASLSHKSHKRNIDRSTFIHKCDTCHKCFQKPSQLVRHKRIHTGERPYKCQLCSRAFNQKGSLQIHMSKHNGIKPFHCEFCAAAFSQKGNLRAHIVRVHTIPNSGEQVYKCMECPCVFKKLGSLNAHMSRMHCGDAAQKTDVSDTSDASHMVNVRAVLSQLAELEADVAGNKTKTLDQPSDADILQQALVNSGLSGKDQPAVQGLQGSASKQENKMKGGIRDESGTVRQHKDTSTTSYITLADRGLDGTVRRYIIRQRRVGTVRWHQCSYCSKEFKKPSDLVRHIRIHTHERPYKCTHCFRSFAVKSTLTAHIRTHTGVRDHVCYICLKKFSSASSLKVHIRMHTGTKPFACQLCDKTFRTTGHQKAHMLCHTKENGGTTEGRVSRRKLVRQKSTLPELPEVALQEPIIITNNGFVQAVARNSTVFLPSNTVSLDRPYTCHVCNAAFRKLSHLKQHIRMHTGERPYKCNLCGRHFISNGVLKAHQRTHEGVKSYKCPECSNMFSTNGSLKRHMGTHSDLRPFMCPYCHKTFKTSVNCRKHIKTHKHELALQVAQQTVKEDGTNVLNTIPVSGQDSAVVTDSTNFPPEGLGPDFAQAFSDQPFQVASTTEQQEQEESAFAQNTLVDTLTSGPLEDSTDPVTAPAMITHTLHADATGTITLPSLAGQHTLTQENIREIERTLNEQIFGTSANVTSDLVSVGGASSDLAARVEVGGSDSEVESTTTEDLARTLGATSSPSAQPDASTLGTLSEGPKDNGRNKNTAEPASNSSVFGTSFDSAGFDSCVFSAITLQSDALELEGLGSGSAMTTNMASILPPPGDAMPEPGTAAASAPTCKSELLVMPPMDGPVAAAAAAAAAAVAANEADKNYVPGRPFSADAPPGERPFKCKQCSRAFKKSYHLKEHARSHVGKNLSCTLCERKCTTFGALRAHMKTHDGTRDFGCDLCGCRFTTSGSLKRHMIVHSDERPLKCSICNATFRTDHLLRRHITLHEPRERKGKLVATNPLQPPRGRRRAAVIRLTAEETQVLAQQPLDNAATVSEKVLIASVAEKDRISELKDPEQQYNMEPIHPNQCKFCPKSFRKPSDLVRHIRIHTGERPYKCACCNKCFTVKSTLDSHLKTHGGQKLFACHVCGCLFSTKGSLKVHMRLHTGAKPFKCPLCEMRFRTSGHRKAHLMSHMKHVTGDSKLSSQLTISARRSKQVPGQQQEQESEVQNPATSTTSELVTDTMTHITLDPATLSSLMPGEPFNSSLLTATADGNHVVGNFQLQLTDGFQIAGVDPSGTVHSYTTQAVQLDEALLHQFQASNIIIQTTQSNSQVQNHVEEGNTLEDQQQQEVTVDAGAEMSTVRFEIHTDEHGQIINIQPAVLQEIASRNGGDITFDLTGGLDMDAVEGDRQPQASRFHITDCREDEQVLGAIGNQTSGGQKDKESGSTSDEYLLFHNCATCGKHFSKPSQLERHTRIHTGERPFACFLCAKTFNQKNALNTHLNSHTGERPFPCPYCHYSSTQKGNLKTHMRRAHRFSSLEISTNSTVTVTTSTTSPSTSTRSLLKPKRQPTLTNLNSSVDLATGKSLDLEKVVGDLFPQMRNTTSTDP